jgi:hypothetical protein
MVMEKPFLENIHTRSGMHATGYSSAAVLTFLSLYAPHSGQAVWGSLGSWHSGQVVTVGAWVL